MSNKERTLILGKSESGDQWILQRGEVDVAVPLDQETQALLSKLFSHIEMYDDKPEIIKQLEEIGFEFGTLKDTGWKPENRNLI